MRDHLKETQSGHRHRSVPPSAPSALTDWLKAVVGAVGPKRFALVAGALLAAIYIAMQEALRDASPAERAEVERLIEEAKDGHLGLWAHFKSDDQDESEEI